MQDTIQTSTENVGEVLHDIPGVQRRLGDLKRSSVYQLIQQGRIRTVHIGRRVFVPSSEIDRYIASLMAGDAQ